MKKRRIKEFLRSFKVHITQLKSATVAFRYKEIFRPQSSDLSKLLAAKKLGEI